MFHVSQMRSDSGRFFSVSDERSLSSFPVGTLQILEGVPTGECRSGLNDASKIKGQQLSSSVLL